MYVERIMRGLGGRSKSEKGREVSEQDSSECDWCIRRVGR